MQIVFAFTLLRPASFFEACCANVFILNDYNTLQLLSMFISEHFVQACCFIKGLFNIWYELNNNAKHEYRKLLSILCRFLVT